MGIAPPDQGGGGGSSHEHFWERVADWLNAYVRDRNIPDALKRYRDDTGNFSPRLLAAMHKDMRENLAREFMNRTDPGAPFDPGWLNDPGEGGGGGGSGGGQGGGSGGGGGGGPGPGGGGGGGNGPGGGGGHGGGHGDHAGGTNSPHAINLANMYGWSMAVLNSVPELRAIFKKAISQHWTPARFNDAVRDTKWFKTHSSAMRKFVVLKATDPAEFHRQVSGMRATVHDMWGQLTGVPLDFDVATKIATQALKFGMNDAELRDRIVGSMHFRKMLHQDNLGGSAAKIESQIREAADAYGVHVGNKFIAKQLEDILSNKDTLDGALNRIQDMAMSKYKMYRAELEGGKTMEEIADPYRQSMAALLEINPEGISIFNQKLQSALNGQKTKDGDRAEVPIWQFEDLVRKDPRYLHTDQAKDSFMDVGMSLLQSFGLQAQ